MAKTAKPFRYRGKWRAQVTLRNGMRPHYDCPTHEEAKLWIAEQLTLANSEHLPELGGPSQANLALALHHYATLITVGKRGIDSELNRINHYLAGAQMPLLRRTTTEQGALALEAYEPKPQPKAWQAHNDVRRAQRSQTYEAIHALANKRCSTISTADMRRLMTTMKNEGLSDSTIQKEIALLRHLFNVAAKEWQWKGFENPTEGLKLGKSASRFVFITPAQEQALWQAVSECDNPYVWPLMVCALETTMRRKSLLAMRWDMTDLDGRLARVPSKTGDVTLPLSQHIVSVLRDMPRHESGRVFPMSDNAVDMAWDGIRIKAGLPKLQFRDIRHLGATALARRGHSAHELQGILGHKTRYMADVYVNLVQADILRRMDELAPLPPDYQVPPKWSQSPTDTLREKRSLRLAKAALASRQQAGSTDPVVVVAASSPPRNTELESGETTASSNQTSVTATAPSPAPGELTPLAALQRALPAPAASTGGQATAKPAQEPVRGDTQPQQKTGVVLPFPGRRSAA